MFLCSSSQDLGSRCGYSIAPAFRRVHAQLSSQSFQRLLCKSNPLQSAQHPIRVVSTSLTLTKPQNTLLILIPPPALFPFTPSLEIQALPLPCAGLQPSFHLWPCLPHSSTRTELKAWLFLPAFLQEPKPHACRRLGTVAGDLSMPTEAAAPSFAPCLHQCPEIPQPVPRRHQSYTSTLKTLHNSATAFPGILLPYCKSDSCFNIISDSLCFLLACFPYKSSPESLLKQKKEEKKEIRRGEGLKKELIFL